MAATVTTIEREPAGQNNQGATTAKKLLAGLLVFALLALVGSRLAGELSTVALWLDGLGPLAPLAFIGTYAIATVAMVPGILLTLSAGALFGLVPGTLYTFVAATTGASLSFLVSRYAVRGTVERWFSANRRFSALDRAVARDGRRIVFLLRLSPLFPFNALNYALGITDIRFSDYLLACAGMLPGTLLYVYYGKLAGDVALAAGGLAPERGFAYYAVMALGLAATLTVTAYVARLARRALAEVERD
jgi:uncharacterized membrane protein YdjX (TVP38/TMEM64 family)